MNNLDKIQKFLRTHKYLTLCLVFVFSGLLFFGNTHHVQAGGPEERPLNALLGTSNNGSQYIGYTMGTSFTVNADGYIDKLWANIPAEAATFYLYDTSNQQVLASVSATGAGFGTWASGAIAPVYVTSGHTYIVAVSKTGYVSSYSGSTSYTTGNITVNAGYWVSGLNTYPTNYGGGTYYGLADVSYHTGSPINYSLTSSQSGNFNVGTTWGGSCASSCVAGTDYPGTNESVIIANGHTVTLTGNQTVASATINSGGTLSLGSNTLTISGSGTPFVKNGTFTPGTGTIQYTNVTSATVTATTYYNLTTGGTGTYTLASGTTTVTNSATISSGATLSLSSNTLVLSGTGTPLTTTGTFTASTGTVQYTGTTANVNATAFYNLTLGGTGTYTMPGSTVTMKGSLVVTNGATVTKGAGTIVYSGTSSQTITDNNTTKQDLGSVQVSNPVTWCNISSSACNSSWLYRRKITFNNSASSSNLTNFPVLVSLTSSNVDYSNTQNSGQDIRFVDADGTTALNYEIEKWDESGTSLVWVKVPQIDASSSTDFIYMYYGNVSATDNQAAVNTWSAGYAGVWHLKDGNTLSVADSIGFNTGTNNGATASTGKIDGGASFSGSSQSIDLGGSAPIQVTTGTIGAWVKTSNAGAGYRGIITKQGNYGLFLVDNALVVYDWNYGNAYSGPTLNDNAWHYVAFVFQNGVASGSQVYVDGVASGSAFTWNSSWNTVDLVLGAAGSPAIQLMAGQLDEARVANTARNADWIKADYLTGNNTMNSFGSEESNGTVSVLQGSSIKVTSLTIDSTTSFSANGTNTLTLTGNNVGGISPLVVNGTFTPSTGTVDFSSASTTGTTIPSLTYYNLTMNKASNTFTAAGTLAVNNLTLIAGTFVAPSGNLTINGNFSNSGTFTHNNGTVILAPTTLTANITGTTTFNNLSDTTAGSTLQFTNGNTYTFAGTLTATGTSQNPIWLKSVSNGSQWTVTFSGSASLSYVNVMDGACSGGNTLSKNNLLYNYGNNGPCWNFVLSGNGGVGASGSDARGNTSGESNSGSGGVGSGTTQATATAVRNGTTIQSVTVNNGGTGYTTAPSICFQDSSGSGATATATISGGSVTVITVITNGTNYSVSVSVGISAPPGTGGSGCSSNSGGGQNGGGGASP